MSTRHLQFNRSSIQNRLLRALPEAELKEVWGSLELVPLRQRQTLIEPDLRIRHVYFMESGTACVISRSNQHRLVELGMIGRMGLVGAPAVLGVESSMFRCFVQIPGEALRLDTDQLWRFLQAYPIFRQLLFNYVQALMTLQGQNIVCGIRHNVHQRVARWLLMALDRMDGTEIPATHDLMARMLGARRASVTQAIGDLEAAQAIAHARGQLTVVDRPKLESLACECYGLVRLEYDRLLRPESISRAFPKTKLEAFAAAFKLGRE